MGRLQAELKRRDYGGAILYDPVNIRYATGAGTWRCGRCTTRRATPSFRRGQAVIFDFHNASI